mmetsp:Transcript_26872/g.37243  ORF Transcript_26872/g.37243 Transcript_26872/m.37243 type:complete len:247 (+) Transcript_26872:82-822(+)|eukprot:jgi/Bigna1/90664/estExt_fgenesh1_pg.C_760023
MASYYEGTWIGHMDALGKKSEWRDKTGKVIQYSAKLAAFVLENDLNMGDHEAAGRLKKLSKWVGASRKIFKLGKFLKHFEDIEDCMDEKTYPALKWADFVMNMAKDITENIETVTKYGFLPKSYGVIMGKNAEDIADFTKMVQCLVSFVNGLVEIGRMEEKIKGCADIKKLKKLNLKNSFLYWAQIKYLTDGLKCAASLGYTWAPGKRGAIICGLLAGLADSRKQTLKNWDKSGKGYTVAIDPYLF